MAFLFFQFIFSGLLTFAGPQAEKVSTIVVVGDSLTEGYGVTREKAFPALLEVKLNEQKIKKWKVINAGVSGSTTASGLSRLKWQLKSKPEFVIVALGANDGLRGTKPEVTEKNLSDMIQAAQAEKVTVLLAQMHMPPNYGPEYTKKYSEIFPNLAKKYKVHLVPFMLNKVAGNPELNLADGIHPNEKGHAIIAETFFESIKGVLR